MAYGMDDEGQTRTIGLARIGTGLVQGVALWALTEAADNKVWPATSGVLFGVLAAVVLFTPFVVLGGLADMRRRTLVIWTLAAAAGLAALGAHDIDRRAAHEVVEWISGQAMVFLAAVLFITHHLVSAADSDRRLIARFPTYFDQAWKHGVQLVMSAGFVGVFWLVLFLGAALFKLIGIEFVEELTRKSWFAIPATTTMFAAAVQLTDVRHGLIRGIRTVALTLLSWLLPVLVFLTGAFMLALPFTGLEPLWKTRSAAAILLSAAAVMIVLINAAYQDGEPDTPTPLVLRWAGRIGGLLLLPLVGVAAYALSLRIGQYGLTPDRIIAAACVVAGIFYAVGYSLAAVLPGVWMKRLETANVVTAFVTVGLILALFSPLADPARLSVNDQMARIADGRVKPDKVDYRFLRFDGEKYGHAALQRLVKKGGDVGKRAAEALNWTNKWGRDAQAPESGGVKQILVWPKDRTLPAAFLTRAWDDDVRPEPACDGKSDKCEATFADMNGDKHEEILLAFNGIVTVYQEVSPGKWQVVGRTDALNCNGDGVAVGSGKVATLPNIWADLSVSGRRVPLNIEPQACPESAGQPDRGQPTWERVNPD
ncbi:MAG: DUF4153 domain-containing protein [Caulobacter sp.]|nr:DUF4153 domain-containing protein [Caulobacter sp.]